MIKEFSRPLKEHRRLKMGKMKELEGKLKELEKMKLMNKLPLPGKAESNTWIAVGSVYCGQGGGK